MNVNIRSTACLMLICFIGSSLSDKQIDSKDLRGKISDIHQQAIKRAGIYSKPSIVTAQRRDSVGAYGSPASANNAYASPQAARAPSTGSDNYGSPLASPSADSYGSPSGNPVSSPDSYGSPIGQPVQQPAAPQKVGGQGNYYYYYPVSAVSSPSTQHHTKYAASTSSSSGGLSGIFSSPLLLIGLALGALILMAVVFSTLGFSGRSLNDASNMFMDHSDELSALVFKGIEMWEDFNNP